MEKLYTKYDSWSTLIDSLHNVFVDLKFKQEDWEDLYSDRESNEPQYDSQIDRWQESLDRLEEKISALEDINDDFETFFDKYESQDDRDSILGTFPYDFDSKELYRIIDAYVAFSNQYRGITPYTKTLLKYKKYAEHLVSRSSALEKSYNSLKQLFAKKLEEKGQKQKNRLIDRQKAKKIGIPNEWYPYLFTC